jgi:CubicO group peptidase (beta-lactamase class C family)
MDTRGRFGTLGAAALAVLGTLAVPTPAAAVPAPAAAAAAAAPASPTCAMTRTEEYPRAEAASVALDPAGLRAAVDYWVRQGAENLKIFRHGCLVAQGALDPATDRIPRQNWSQTKTISALIAGVAVRQRILDVDAPIGRYLPRGVGDAEHRAIPVSSLLTMTSGLEMNWIRGFALNVDLADAQDAMSMPLRHRPGEYFEYEQTTSSVLNWIVQQALRRAGRTIDYQDFAQREFFNKLGIPSSAYWWQRDRSGTTLGHSQLFLRPLEFGRIGELMLRQGVFAGVRLIDTDFMRMLRTGTQANCGYGYLVWLNACGSAAAASEHQVNASIMTRREIAPTRPWIASAPADMYYSWGAHGQHVFVIPSLDLVVTRSGEQSPDSSSDFERLDTDLFFNGAQKGGYFEFFRMLMAAVIDMPAAMRARLADRYSLPSDTGVDVAGWLRPLENEQRPISARPGDPTDHPVDDVSRTVPGVLGVDVRPPGSEHP